MVDKEITIINPEKNFPDTEKKLLEKNTYRKNNVEKMKIFQQKYKA